MHQGISIHEVICMRKIFICTLTLLAVACSGPTDPSVKNGLDALEVAYILKVKPQDASYTKCVNKMIESRHVVRCGISFGSTELVQKGLWEIDASDGQFVVYAMNGKALSALEKISDADKFRSGVGRTPFNTLAVEKAFEGK